MELPPETSLANCVATLKRSRAHTALWSSTPQKGTLALTVVARFLSNSLPSAVLPISLPQCPLSVVSLVFLCLEQGVKIFRAS